VIAGTNLSTSLPHSWYSGTSFTIWSGQGS